MAFPQQPLLVSGITLSRSSLRRTPKLGRSYLAGEHTGVFAEQ
ncbi:hypothetical protein [Pseudomonas savastanoi]|nr:hypothetical protein [Pseudomonas savastanoi]